MYAADALKRQWARQIIVLFSSWSVAKFDSLGNPADPLCSAGAGDPQLAVLVRTLSAQVVGLRIGRHFSIRDVIKWAHRMQVTLLFSLDV